MAGRILVVDDNRNKLERIIRLLEDGGANRSQVDVAQSGVEARLLLSKVQYDLLILDIALPMRPEEPPDRQGGIKLLDEVVERDLYQKPISVVGLTGFDDLYKDCSDLFRSRLWTLEQYDPSDQGWMDRLRAKTRYTLARAEQKNPTDFATDVCVITALHSPELRALTSLDWGWSAANSLDEVGYYYEGQFSSSGAKRSVVAAAAPRMGMVSSAILSLKMIMRFHPRLLVMVGMCAGIKGRCSIGDVLVADPAWDWQMGKYENGTFSVAPDQIGIRTAVGQRFVQLAEDKQLWFKIHEDFAGSKPDKLPTVIVGPVTSGSAVLADKKILIELREQHRKLLGVEMELYGMYAAARDCSPPAPLAFGIKSVCDYADDQKGDLYQSYSSHVSARTLVAFCERYAADFL